MALTLRLCTGLLLFALVNSTASAQDCADKTGNSSTIIIDKDADVSGLKDGDLLLALTPEDACAGQIEASTILNKLAQDESVAFTVWGDNEATSEKEGFAPGDTIRYVASRPSNGKRSAALVTYTTEDLALPQMNGTYAPDQADKLTMIEVGSLPVELVGFQARVDGQAVLLSWQTASETNNAYFAVEQQTSEGAFEPVGRVEGHGTTTRPQRYAFRLEDAQPGTHRFRLKQVDFDGAFEYSTTVEATVELAETYRLSPSYPNPFSTRTRFDLTVSRPQHVTVDVYNALGQRVTILYEGTLKANKPHTFALRAGGLPSGLYLVRIVGERFSETQRLVLIK